MLQCVVRVTVVVHIEVHELQEETNKTGLGRSIRYSLLNSLWFIEYIRLLEQDVLQTSRIR